MTQLATASPSKSKQTLLVIWAAAATLAASLSSALAILFFFQARQPSNTENRAVAGSPFLALPESVIPGRYKLIENGEESFITLNADHTFLEKSGRTAPMYRWEILRDGFLMVWRSGTMRFDHIEAPGVYTGAKANGVALRMEKVE